VKGAVGLVHVYIGPGKGKTTAAVGLSVRVLGHGGRVLFVQFLKDAGGGESVLAGTFPERFDHRLLGGSYTLSVQPDPEHLAAVGREISRSWPEVLEVAGSGGYELVVLDEALTCVELGIWNDGVIVDAIDRLKGKVEVVLTGHRGSREVIDRADYVSVIEARKHPYQQGVKARKGIEY
jgi:cob(I)alamin adenosyltransferase